MMQSRTCDLYFIAMIRCYGGPGGTKIYVLVLKLGDFSPKIIEDTRC